MLLWLHVCFKQFVDLNHCVTEEHYYLRKNAMSTVGFYPRTSHIVSHHSTNRAQAISRDVMKRLRYTCTIGKVQKNVVLTVPTTYFVDASFCNTCW
jgi:hypothetical protein